MMECCAPVRLANPEHANLLALVLERMLRNAVSPRPNGTYLLRAGRMCARLAFTPQETVVTSGEGPADCEIIGSLASFAALGLGASAVSAWWRGTVRWRGSPFRALRLARFLRHP